MNPWTTGILPLGEYIEELFNEKENKMITAKEAREIYESNSALIDINNKIIGEAKNGRSYITIINLSEFVVKKLNLLGYTVKYNPESLDYTISW